MNFCVLSKSPVDSGVHIPLVIACVLFPLIDPCSRFIPRDVRGCERVWDRLGLCVYIHVFAQRYPACVRPTGVERLSIAEVNKNPSSTKREQTATVCSGFPNKHSRRIERERERGGGRPCILDSPYMCNIKSNSLIHEREMIIQPY